MDNNTSQNPIVAMAQRIRARKAVEGAVDSATPDAVLPPESDAGSALEAFGAALAVGTRRLNSILGSNAMTYVRLQNPLRIRIRFGSKRIAFDVDEVRQLVVVRGLGLDGEYQFDGGAEPQGLINLSLLSTDAGYGVPLTPNAVLKTIAADAELPRPAHLDAFGPLG